MLISHSPPSHPAPPSTSPSAPPAPDNGDVPKLEDVFDGSKAKFGPAHSKYIASAQVPHSIDSKAYYDADADAAEATRYYSGVAGITDPAKKTAALHDLVTST